jgi:hypothetical protein
MKEPSVSEANKLLRVLTGERQKYTIRIHRIDGSILEFQSDVRVSITYNDPARCLWFVTDYPTSPICKYEEGMVVLVEENPNPKP